jgi:hypothetical protein
MITHFTDNDVKVTGNMSGAGILIADGNVTVSGSMTFTGWILAKGMVESLTTGNATIYGSCGPPVFKCRSAAVRSWRTAVTA